MKSNECLRGYNTFEHFFFFFVNYNTVYLLCNTIFNYTHVCLHMTSWIQPSEKKTNGCCQHQDRMASPSAFTSISELKCWTLRYSFIFMKQWKLQGIRSNTHQLWRWGESCHSVLVSTTTTIFLVPTCHALAPVWRKDGDYVGKWVMHYRE